MQVRGRGDRISFAESFKDVYNFRLLYGSSVAFFPIKAWKRRGGGGCSVFNCFSCLSRAAIDHAPLARRSTTAVAAPTRGTTNVY